MLHGGGDRWQRFSPLIPTLAKRWHVYALDLRGHGRSGRVAGRYRPEHYAADVVALLAQRIAGPAILLGHSLGGWVALLTAVQCPDAVRALILGDPPLCIERFLAIEGSAERVAMWRAIRDRASAETTSQVDPDVVQYHAEERLDEYVAQMDVDALLQRIPCPVLLIQGDPSRGGSITDADVAHVLPVLAQGSHVQLAGAGHDLGLSAGEATPLLQAVVRFLGSL
jgi:pimeloyl-ACP methyl ester carboxylesterase